LILTMLKYNKYRIRILSFHDKSVLFIIRYYQVLLLIYRSLVIILQLFAIRLSIN
jgi:hypothetical protein